MNASELTKFWDQCPLDKSPYQHPCDMLDSGSIQQDVGCYADYVSAFKESRLDDTKFHLGLLPQPYHGDLENAEAIILLKNPGFHASDYIAEEGFPEFRKSIVKTIRQRMGSHMFLDPNWAWTSGFTWWESKLRKVGRCIADHKFNGDYPKALACLSRRVACLELVPYHSVSFGTSRKLTQIPSANAARRFAQQASEDRKVIVPRAVKDWDIGCGKHVITYDANQARSASLGPDSLGGRAILELYGL